MTPPSIAELAYEAALKAVASQRERIDSIRTRATTLLSATGIATSFLGAEALRDERIENGKQIANHSLQGAEIVAIIGFIALGVACVYVLWPRKRGWKFEVNAKVLLDSYSGQDPENVHRNLAIHLGQAWTGNERKLDRLFLAFEVASVLLLVEIVAWIVDLA